MFIFEEASEMRALYPIRLLIFKRGGSFPHKVTDTYFGGDLLPYPRGAYTLETWLSNILAVQKAVMKKKWWGW